ncbi:MAG: cytochrome P450, partial [Caulobacterales bacterium]
MSDRSAFGTPAHVPPDLVFPSPIRLGAPATADPYKVLIPELHANAPEVFYAPGSHLSGGGTWIPRRAEDIRAVMLDAESFSSAAQTGLSRLIGQDWDLIPVEIDPPRHGAYRALLNPLFSPKNIARLEASMRTTADTLLDRFAEAGEVDFVDAFAAPFPVSIFLHLLDLPVEEMPMFLEWERKLIHSSDVAVKVEGALAIVRYLEDAIAARRRQPGEDFISYVVGQSIDGQALSQNEIISIVFQLYLGGLDTVSQVMAWQFKHLAETPEDQRAIREGHYDIDRVLEELLRAFPVVSSFRTCRKATTIRGVQIAPGDIVTVSTPIASRDPVTCEAPAEVRFEREPSPHITFAYGPHRCIGSHLARMELRIALERVHARLKSFRLRDETAPGPMHFGSILGLGQLDLVW